MRPLKLIDHDFHFLELIEKNKDNELKTWITVHEDTHDKLKDFIENISEGDQVELDIEDGRFLLIHMDNSIEISLPMFIRNREDFSFIDLGNDIDSLIFEFEKKVWSREEYNQWLQFKSNKEKVYPLICESCGHLMSCTRDHYINSNFNWNRLRCSNSYCENVMATDNFVLNIKEKNKEKLRVSLADMIEEVHKESIKQLRKFTTTISVDVQNGLLSELEIHIRTCKECGGETRCVQRVEVANSTDYIVQDYSACGRCFGGGFMTVGSGMVENELNNRKVSGREIGDILVNKASIDSIVKRMKEYMINTKN